MINTIIFDLSEVYINGLHGMDKKLVPILGREAPKIHDQFHNKDLDLLFNGKVSEDEYWIKVIKENNWRIALDELKLIARENFYKIEGTEKIITTLKKKGFKLGLLSVHAKEWVEFVSKKYNYHRFFNSVSYSFEIGVSKPDKRAYKLILKKLKSKPEECLFVDNEPQNLIPAKEMGIKTIFFTNSEKLRKDLGDLGIIV